MTRALGKGNAVLAGALVVLYCAWWLATGASNEMLSLVALAFAVLPLLALLPGLWREQRFATALAGLVVPFHFAFAVMELFADPAARAWVAVQSFFALVLFVGVMANLQQAPGSSR